MFIFKHYVEVRGLISYGIDTGPMCRRAASCVAKILRGARPDDLPIEQTTNYERTVTLKTAKATGVTLPTSETAERVARKRRQKPAMLLRAVELPTGSHQKSVHPEGQRQTQAAVRDANM
jgi:hypothetical protein